MFRRFGGYGLLLAFLLLHPFSPAAAQNAALTGQITDQTGSSVIGATVTLQPGGGATLAATSGKNGAYAFSNIPPGKYSVLASAPNLAIKEPIPLTLKAGPQVLNLRLDIATLTQQVQVHDEGGNKVSTDSANNASALVISGEQLDALSDDPEDLQADLQGLAGPAAGPNGGAIFVDGFSSGEVPPKASIREIRINQNPFSPEYDKLGYGRIEIFTKPGTNKFHGNLGYNFANEFWNSRNPYAAEKAPLHLNEFENEATGPLGKRASFTLDVERHAVDNGSIVNAVTLNPQTLLPSALADVITTPQRRIRIDPRIDYQLNDKNTLTVRYVWTRSDVHDAGIGSFDLSSRGYGDRNTYGTLQVGDTVVLGNSINETRFQWFRWKNTKVANSFAPEIQVLNSFTGGGSQLGASSDTQNSYELQNYTSSVRGAHTWRFGVRLRGAMEDSISPLNFSGTFTFAGGLVPQLDPDGQPIPNAPEINLTSIQRYQRTLLLQQLGRAPGSIQALGGGAAQFTISAGNPQTVANMVDAGVFVGDEWHLKPNLTLNLGLRYETQTNIHDHGDFAPRVAIAWQPSIARKTVVRAGFGLFYDRFPLTNTLTALRYNSVVQQQYVVNNPDFYPAIPQISSLAAFSQSQVIEKVDSNLRAPYVMQSAVMVEHQLLKNTTVAGSYINSHGVHLLRSENINAPLPGTYNLSQPASGVFPYKTSDPIFLMSSSGIYNQNQVIFNANSRLNSQVNLFGFYVWNKAMSNTDGISTFPANPYNYSGEYGPAATDIRHRVLLGGSINTTWNVRLSPYFTVQSGIPFNLTAGRDLYATTLFNGRPGIATNPNEAGVIQTAYGLLDPNSTPGETLLSRNYGRGPDLIALNLRLSKTFAFGGGREAASHNSGGGGSGSMGSAGIPTGRELRNLFGAPSASRRYSLTVGLSARNILNHNNPGPIIGNITSPLFGQANQIYGTPNGEGFSETANNRRLELQIQFKF